MATGVPRSAEAQEIEQALSQQGWPVSQVIRLKVGDRAIPKCIIEFTEQNAVSTALTKGLTLGFQHYRCVEYIQKSRPPMCGKCYSLDHRADKCPSNQICSKCSSTEHTREQCSVDQPRCAHCGGDHSPTYKGCELSLIHI